ncbi:MAG: SurA N-terminal domain-containing protein [Propionibacteriaceae bacterium]|jgi:hypothetical protein|nr:SurA N-terminal domain-containing protein [Propionibacteriaceae bacterium]
MRRIPGLLLAAAVAVTALTGCTQSPNVLATVGDTTIRQADVDSIVTSLNSLFGERDYELKVTQWLIDGRLYDQAVAESGVTLPQALIDAAVAEDSSFATMAGDAAVTEAYTDLYKWSVCYTLATSSADDIAQIDAYYSTDSTAFDGAKFLEAAQNVQVDVNPRYGMWDAELLSIGNAGLTLAAPLSSVTTAA